MALLGSACGEIRPQGGRYPDSPERGFFGNVEASPAQVSAWQRDTQRGYNGTIQHVPTSIDPRTPQAEGTPGRSLPADLAWQQQGQGLGGAGTRVEGGPQGLGDSQGPMYRERQGDSPQQGLGTGMQGGRMDPVRQGGSPQQGQEAGGRQGQGRGSGQAGRGGDSGQRR